MRRSSTAARCGWTSGGAIATGPIDFAAVSGTSGGTLDLTGEGSGSAFTSSFTTAISGFTGEGSTAATSDIIDVTGTGAAGDHVVWTQNGASGTLQVENASNVVLESMTLDGTYAQSWFRVTESGSVDQITYVSYTTGGGIVGSGQGHSASVSNTIIVSGGNQIVGYDFGTGTATNTIIRAAANRTSANCAGPERRSTRRSTTAAPRLSAPALAARRRARRSKAAAVSMSAREVGLAGRRRDTTVDSGGSQSVGDNDVAPGRRRTRS